MATSRINFRPRSSKRRSNHSVWLAQIIPTHERLTRTAVSLLQNSLFEKKIEFLSVNGRTKTTSGAIEKINRKKYRDPQTQLTDLSGIRVVTFLESQVRDVSDLIRALFEVDDGNSLDRSKILGSDKIGYRSTHFVCTLGAQRSSLPEYESFKDLKFEIQVRTVLQHGWAELAHDRSFKFGPGLPTHIQRKLNLYAGMLEVVDDAFDGIAREIDTYASSLKDKSLEQISKEEITQITLEKYLVSVAKQYKVALYDFEIAPDLFEELFHFGIKTTGQLEAITTAENMDAYTSVKDPDTGMGFIREMMMLADIQKYFSVPFDWKGLDEASYKRLLKKYAKRKLDSLLNIHDITVYPDIVPEESSSESNDMDDEIPF